MINYKNNSIFNLLNRKCTNKFQSCSSFLFYDKRIRGAFRSIMTAPKIDKYYFTDSTMERIVNINLAKCYPTKMGYLFNKFGGEVGVCICKEDNLAFIYVIGINNIKILVTSGTQKSMTAYTNDFGNTDYSTWHKAMVGSAIISYDTNKVNVMPATYIGMISTPGVDFKGITRELKSDLQKFFRHYDKYHKTKESGLTPEISPYLKAQIEDDNIKTKKIWKAIQMFVFLKTAKVIDKTFISDNNDFTRKATNQSDKDDGIIVVDSHWDSSIKVINPFAVSGHFRNQPKKNEKKEWYTEIIYIDSFMKQGYSRGAKMDNCNKETA